MTQLSVKITSKCQTTTLSNIKINILRRCRKSISHYDKNKYLFKNSMKSVRKRKDSNFRHHSGENKTLKV
ncbi:CLUMA_CG007162, isoform A [Clunio marinus]|uniref:CLUMA_CG007162, isoform A n=1 Tax=Clunio marinus TaxID=568069 RepID=A0A1J1HZV9_9DIPT|nr:CLUMA_CG007162, isoform A [Clunio marinus]